MTNKEKVLQFRKIVNEMADLYEKKNQNYGNSFGKLYEDLGPVAGLVPLHNKLDRATNLVKGGKNDFESLEDTFKDLACYAIMNLIEMQAKDNQDNKIRIRLGKVDIDDYGNFYTTDEDGQKHIIQAGYRTKELKNND